MPRHSALFIALAQVGVVSAASAATITVTSSADTVADDGNCTLREAITNANSDSALYSSAGECVAGMGSDTIELPAGQTITLASSLSIASSISITGNGARLERSGACNLDGTTDTGEFRLITANSGGDTISLSNFTLANGCADGSSSAGRGGGLYSFTNYLTLQSMRFENNQARGYGGALASFAEGVSSLAISDSVFSGNTAVSQGGAIRSNSVSPLIEDSTFSNNVSAYGGAIHHRYGSPTINRSSFSGNSVSGQGGAISFRRHPSSPGQLFTLNSSTLEGNTAGKGGSVFASGSVSLQNSTVSGNSATSGGGVYLNTMGGLVMSDSSLVDNSGAGGSQIFWSEGSTVDVQRSLLVGASPACNTGSTAASGSDSLATDSSCNVVGGSVVSREALQLQPLSNQGGGTKVHPLGNGSVAIDAGGTACSETDQRGEVRLFGSACDVGAFEVNETATSGSDFVVNALGDAGDGFCGTASGECTLRDAVLAANSNADSSAITFDAGVFAAAQTIPLAQGEIAITTPVTLIGPGAELLTVDAGGTSRHLLIDDGAGAGVIDVAISDLTFTNGAGNFGGAIRDAENLALNRVTLSGNSASQVGNALFVEASAPATVSIVSSSLSDNIGSAKYGGAAEIRLSTGSTLTIEDSHFDRNQALGSASVGRGGGARVFALGSTITVSNSTFSQNSVNSTNVVMGVGLYLQAGDGGKVTLDGLNVVDNIGIKRALGAGLYLRAENGGSVSLTRSTITGNSSSATSSLNGGGVYFYGDTLSVSDSTFSGNSAAFGGGAYVYVLNGMATLDRLTISDNDASGDGGGLWLVASSGASSMVSNLTVTGNSAQDDGGGISLQRYAGAGSVSLTGSTISGNTAANGSSPQGGGLLVSSDDSAATLTLSGNVVAGNADVTAPDVAINLSSVGPITFSNNLIGDNTGSGLAEAQTPDGDGNLIGTSSTPIDPLLGALADNGGDTQTMLPQLGSPAIDAFAGCSGNDQRGNPRGSDLDGSAGNDCDIGAVEFQYTAMVAQGETEGPVAEDAVAAGFDNLLNNEVDPADDYVANFEVVAVAGSAANLNVDQSVNGALFTIAANGGAVFKPNGAFEALDDGETGTASIAYSASDGQRSDVATLTVNVAGANDAPVSSDGAIVTTEDSVGQVTLGVTDVDVEPQTLSQVSAPSAGSVSFDSANLIASFNPNGQFEALDDGESQQVVFTFKANDGTVDSNVATVTVTVNGANDAPVAQNDTYTVQAGETLSIDAAAGLLANDTDIDVEALAITSIGTVTPDGVGGSLTLNADGSFSYTAPNEGGTASYEYTVSDGETSTTGTVNFTVSGFPAADLSISKDDGTTQVSPGDVLTYTITVHNAGPANAQGVRVQDSLPGSLGNATWSCEAVMPSANTACADASGSGSIDQLVNIGSGDSVVYELMATVDPNLPFGEIANTATVTAPANRSDSNTANNSATDRNQTGRIFSEGFEDRVVTKRFDDHAMVLNAQTIELRLPLDAGYKPLLVARAVSTTGASDLVLVHARRFDGALQIKLGRWVDGEWTDSGWIAVQETQIQLNW